MEDEDEGGTELDEGGMEEEEEGATEVVLDSAGAELDVGPAVVVAEAEEVTTGGREEVVGRTIEEEEDMFSSLPLRI